MKTLTSLLMSYEGVQRLAVLAAEAMQRGDNLRRLARRFVSWVKSQT